MPNVQKALDGWFQHGKKLICAASLLLTTMTNVAHADHLSMATLQTNFDQLDDVLLRLNELITRDLPYDVSNQMFPAARMKRALLEDDHCTAVIQRTDDLEDQYLWVAYMMELPISFYRSEGIKPEYVSEESITAVLRESYAELAADFLGIETWRGDSYQQILTTVQAGRVDDWLVVDYVPELLKSRSNVSGLVRVGEVISVEGWTACGPGSDSAKVQALRSAILSLQQSGGLQAFYRDSGAGIVTKTPELPQSGL
jgi:hypothetical protein